MFLQGAWSIALPHFSFYLDIFLNDLFTFPYLSPFPPVLDNCPAASLAAGLDSNFTGAAYPHSACGGRVKIQDQWPSADTAHSSRWIFPARLSITFEVAVFGEIGRENFSLNLPPKNWISINHRGGSSWARKELATEPPLSSPIPIWFNAWIPVADFRCWGADEPPTNPSQIYFFYVVNNKMIKKSVQWVFIY